MTLKQYLLIFALGTIVAGIALAFLITGLDPTQTPWFAQSAFFLTLSIASVGFFATISTTARLTRLGDVEGDSAVQTIVSRSLRQSVVLTLLIDGALFAASRGIAPWIALLVPAVLAIGLEAWFLRSEGK